MTPITERIPPWLAFAFLFLAFHFVFEPFFPILGNRLGHDFSFFFPQWLDGSIWFQNNGLTPPWFSPSFCAGQPFFADLQSGYYSLPQFLAIAFGPLHAAWGTLLLCATAMFWGGYFLMRKVFTANRVAAVLVGGLLMFNGFLPHRLMVGHVSYHGFALLPLLTLLLLVPTTQRTATMAVTTGAGILLAYWVHSGFAVIMLPALLSVALIAWMARMSTGLPLTRFAGRAMLAGLIGLGLSASKLWASFSFLSHFPRTFYALPGFATPWEGLTSLGAALFLPSQWAHEVGVERLVNVQWALAPHEWAYGFGPGVLLLLFWVKRPRLTASLWIWTGLILGLLMPLAISLWQADWNAFLKSLPLLGSMSNPLRWWITYIPAVAVVAGLALPKQRSNAWLAGAVLVLTMITSAWEPRAYYQSQNYDVRPILVADEALRSGGWIPKIERLGLTAHIQAGSFQAPLRSNDTFIAGVSQVFCYNPVFGYRLEKFVAQGLTVESVLTESDGFLNLKNPACYVFPKENGCLPGDRFRADQRASAVAFVNYRPFEFAISRGQMIANAISGIFLILVCVVGVGSFHYP